MKEINTYKIDKKRNTKVSDNFYFNTNFKNAYGRTLKESFEIKKIHWENENIICVDAIREVN